MLWGVLTLGQRREHLVALHYESLSQELAGKRETFIDLLRVKNTGK